MAMSRLVAIAPNPSIDRLVEVATLRHGEIHRPLATTVVAGGKGLNLARTAAALQIPVLAIGPLAGHAGQWIAQALASEGVEVRAVWVEGETRTCTSILDRSDGATTEIYEAGVAITAAQWRLLLDTLAEVLATSDAAGVGLVTVSGSLPPGVEDEGLAQIVRVARAAKVPVAIDGHGPALILALGAHPWLVKVNLDEAREALGDPSMSSEEAVRGLLSAGASRAIVTLGHAGAIVAPGDGSLIHLKPPTRGIYTVGAGDAFLGGLAAGILGGESLPEAAVTGIATAAASSLVPGAGRIDVAAVPRLRADVRVEPIAASDHGTRS
jgi:1-phosphofructokinase family hexose kinase